MGEEKGKRHVETLERFQEEVSHFIFTASPFYTEQLTIYIIELFFPELFFQV